MSKVKGPKSKIQKLEEKLGEEAVAKFRAMNKSERELEFNRICKLKEAEIILRNEDVELNDAKNAVKELNAPYAENLKDYSLKLSFLYVLFQEESK
jgi:hypothetical protein